MPAAAEEFPSRPITWIVPFAPGGITDTTSRLVADEMSKSLGQTVLIDNRGGAGGTVGTEQAARSRPDGYTILYGTQGTMAANVTLRKNLSYDPLTSFLPVHMMAESPNIFVAFEGAPFNSVPELIAYARKHPGKVTFSSAGVGTGTHLVAELFKTVAGIDMLHVPYKGSAPALNDLIAGRIDVMFDYPVSVGPHIEARQTEGAGDHRADAAEEHAERADHGRTRIAGYDHRELVEHHGAGGHAARDRRPAGGRRAYRADLGARSHPFRKVRHQGDDAAEGRGHAVHPEGDQALGDVIEKAGLEKQ